MVATLLKLLLITDCRHLKERVKKILTRHPEVKLQCKDGIPENQEGFDGILSEKPLETLSSLAERTHLHILESKDSSDELELELELERFLETVRAVQWVANTATQTKADKETRKGGKVASPSTTVTSPRERSIQPRILAFGASTGGPQSLSRILPHFPPDFPLPIVVVQHAPPGIGKNMVDFLQQGCAMPVMEIAHGVKLERGNVYVAPGGYHTRLGFDGERNPILLLGQEDLVNDCRPSVDVFFQSISQTFHGHCIAALLTGMGSDGAAGLKTLHELGAITLAESKESCTVFGMPAAAIRLGAATRVMRAEDLAFEILRIAASEVGHGM